jgi:hypothetical protein
MNLKQQVEKILPNWEKWYRTPFEAAVDLGLLKETPDSGELDLRKRHKKVQQEAEEYFKERWNITDDDE